MTVLRERTILGWPTVASPPSSRTDSPDSNPTRCGHLSSAQSIRNRWLVVSTIGAFVRLPEKSSRLIHMQLGDQRAGPSVES